MYGVCMTVKLKNYLKTKRYWLLGISVEAKVQENGNFVLYSIAAQPV
jgi:hypothetical protein